MFAGSNSLRAHFLSIVLSSPLSSFCYSRGFSFRTKNARFMRFQALFSLAADSSSFYSFYFLVFLRRIFLGTRAKNYCHCLRYCVSSVFISGLVITSCNADIDIIDKLILNCTI